MEESVAVLLSTYNGEKFLREQLDSLINQTYDDFVIYIRDDGSSDRTVCIVNEYKRKFPKLLQIIDDNLGNIGFKRSFDLILKYAEADYYFFCDQDDIWANNKISKLIFRIKTKENNMPLLVYSDLDIIDEKSNKKNKSFFKKYKLRNTLSRVLIIGGVPGCSMGFNNELKEIYIKKNIDDIFVHDQLIYFFAKIYGEIVICNERLIMYRIHANNSIGVKRRYRIIWSIKDFVKYSFKAKKYRDIVLKNYYKKQEKIRDTEFYNKEIKTILLSEEEVDNLSFIKRKIWFYKLFLCGNSINFNMLVKLFLV